MNESNYKTLGLDESSSFEEVQVARTRLLEKCEGDPQQKEAIEAAYDSILMERLRMRQEGKIKVPDRIRFAEKTPEASASMPRALPAPQPPGWLQDWLDTPSRNDVLWPSVAFLALAALAWFATSSASTALGFSVAATVFFVNRKERKFWRSCAFAAGGLLGGVLLGLLAMGLVGQQSLELSAERVNAVVAVITMTVLWFISSFLR